MTRFLILAILTLSACAKNPYAEMTDEEIHARAQSMPLTERYDFYLEVLDSRIPSNPIVAEDIVLLGPTARQYTFGRALQGGRDALLTALPVLSAFDAPCSSTELRQLKEAAQIVAMNEEDRRGIDMHIMVACEKASPPGYRSPWANR